MVKNFGMKLFWIITLIAVLLDQLTKYIIKTNFNFTKNYGAAFGILQGKGSLLIVISILVLIVLIYYNYKNKKEFPDFATGLLAGGIIGNLIDRILLGYVIDFIDFGWFPSFNLADSFNTIGVALLILYSFKK